MFERYITDALTTHFGHILENVDSDKMRLSVWNGELTLEDVAIKTTALDVILGTSKNCPVEIAYGHIGTFRVKIPWSLLSELMSDNSNNDGSITEAISSTGTATAISVVLSDVNILITPRQKVDEKENSDGIQATSNTTLETRRANKERKVQSLLDVNLLKRVTESSIFAAEAHEVATSGSWSTWVREKLSQLLSNLSITVKNIHIRYEDPGTSMGFEWRIFRRNDKSDDEQEINPAHRYDHLSLDLNDEDHSPLSRRTTLGGNGYINHQPQRYRPPFAVGITLKEFSVQSTAAPKKKQKSSTLTSSNLSEVEENDRKQHIGVILDDATISSVVSTNTATSMTIPAKLQPPSSVSIADSSTTCIDEDFTIRRQHKRAAAKDLAIYWDSTATLIVERSIRKRQSHQQQQHQTKEQMEDHQQQEQIKQELFEFYQSFFASLDNGDTTAIDSSSPHWSRELLPSSRHKIWATHSYLLNPVSPSIDLTLVSKVPMNLSNKQAESLGMENSDTLYQNNGELPEIPRSSKVQPKRFSSQTTNSTKNTQYSIPPSSVQIEFPPCKFTLSRNTLEDAVYLRKSLSVWNDARKTFVSESALRHVLKLRPLKSALIDPIGWWKYAFEATIVMSRASSSVSDNDYEEEKGMEDQKEPENDTEGKLLRRRTRPLTRRKGWMGLVQAVSRRWKYVQLYEVLLEPPVSPVNTGDCTAENAPMLQKARQEEAHLVLLEMEDGLLAEEVVAFRIHAYESIMKAQEDDDIADNRQQQQQLATDTKTIPSNDAVEDGSTDKSIGRWAAWIRGERNHSNDNATAVLSETENESQTTEREEEHAMIKGETDEDILSIEHRRWMMNETKQALDRERENMQGQFAEDLHQQSVIHMTKKVVLTEDMPNESNPLVWTACLICRQFAVQINDQPTGTFDNYRSPTPVIRMSTGWVQDLLWYHDGSWEVDCSLASTEVKDLISARGKGSTSRYISTLLGSNLRDYRKHDDDYIIINGVRYHRNMSVTVKRRLHLNTPNRWSKLESGGDRGSTTTVQIRVLPMEVVYSALPIEAVKRIFLAVKTPEIVDDYHKVFGIANSWRNKQKAKILETLAHKDKKIIMDVDIAAPELLIPEDIYRPDSPMLAVNFGRFQAYNDDESLDSNENDFFDDQWRMLASNIQVQSTSIASYHSGAELRSSNNLREQLVEAFSIDFVVSTKIVKGDNQGNNEESRISISATLPRLAFNITSSAIRLISRLQQNFAMRRREMQDETAYFESTNGFDNFPVLTNTKSHEEPEKEALKSQREHTSCTSRIFKFNFSAPAITLKLENDVDRMNCKSENSYRSTPIIDLALRSIRGSFVQEIVSNGDSIIKFDASLQSLGVIDLYQSAGRDFILLMSSIPQNQLIEKISTATGYSWDTVHISHDADELYGIRKDLVTLEYSGNNSDDDNEKQSDDNPDKISLWFHELYVEWNPETLAAIHVAIRTPSTEENVAQVSFSGILAPPSEEESSAEEEYFDAVEGEFHDVSDSDSLRAFSVISASNDNLEALGNSSSNTSTQYGSPTNISLISPTVGDGIFYQERFSFSPGSRSSVIGQFQNARMDESAYFEALALPECHTNEPGRPGNQTKTRQIEIVFELSKLRVSFNKETRHRKVIVAQMDRTFISYTTKIAGGSRITMNLGNLIFIDPAHEENNTLYGQILGLQTKTNELADNAFSSLLEMEVTMNPKMRDFSSSLDGDKSATVTIDRERGKMTGSNCFVTAKLSPMKFVLIEQLWMEFMDYFFEGIIGNQVLGGQTKEASSDKPLDLVWLEKRDSSYTFGSDAEGISFTRFDIYLDSPVIIVPVTYSSPEFVRLELSKIHLSNEYDGEIRKDATFGHDEAPGDRMQWFNNCRVSLENLRLFNWSGRELGRNPVVASVSLRWPTGPLAQLVIPKWQVSCKFDSLDISLCRSDYALLQNIISYNIGEQSRHMDEWTVLQNLSANALDEFMKKIIVHYGYDKKNVAPTTYDVKLFIPSLKFSLMEADGQNSLPLAIARCLDLKWQMRKESDLIVTQSVTCGIDLVRHTREKSNIETLMTISKDDSNLQGETYDEDHNQPGFIYSSKSTPNGDNVKTLEIFDPCIYLIVPAWSRFVAFFQSLVPPIFLSKNEIGASIQVGDRWYRIADDSGTPSIANISEIGNVGKKRFNWISTKPIPVPFTRVSPRLSVVQNPPTLQLKILLTWPRIILSSVTTEDNPTRVILRMNHVDFLQTNEGKTFRRTRSLFLHDVEVYTSSQKMSSHYSTSKNEDHHSLIHPWSLSGVATTCNGESIGDCDKHSYNLSGDVLHARAAYSDMAIAIDVFLSVLHSSKEDNNELVEELPQHHIISTSSFDYNEYTDDDNIYCLKPSINTYDVQCDGFELKVADDSGRHFSGYQDLVILSIGKMFCSRHESKDGATSMKLWLDCLDMFDCLQPAHSPFRTAASSRSRVMGIRNSMESEGHRNEPKDANIHENSPRKMSWKEYGTENLGKRNFKMSPSFLKRITEASENCSHYLWGVGEEGPTPGLIEIAYKSTEDDHQEYDVRFRSFAVQWNPSTIIAVQRFLGRLRKESKIISVQVFHSQFDDLIDGSEPDKVDESLTDADSGISGGSSVIRANIQIDSLAVCMNKEHQRRRLLELTFKSCNVVIHSSEQGMTIEGQLGDLSAFQNGNYSIDGSDQDFTTRNNRNVLSVLTDEGAEINGQFLCIQYKTFSKKATSTSKANVPNWVKSNLSSPDDIDDFLSLTVAATRFTYLKERTEELLDYLSNGLPGKGMGVTSRAAKGFISRRIQTRSFLQLRINSPQIYIPQHEMSEQGLVLKLGDVNVQSWFEEAMSTMKESLDSEWWRVLSLKLSGFCCGMIRKGSDFDSLSSATNPIDLNIFLRKPTIKGRTLSIRGNMSCFEVALQYQDYALLRAVANDNIGRYINTDKWDNVEKAYWMEENIVDQRSRIDGSVRIDADADAQVAYSSNARFVRYGKGGKKGRKRAHSTANDQSPIERSESVYTNTLDVRFDLDGVTLKLRRNDLPDGIIEEDDLATAFHYDVMLLRVGVVEVLTTANINGDVSFNLSLFRIGLFDLGDSGRLIRQRYYHSLPNDNIVNGKRKRKALWQPCPFAVLAEGYLSADDNDAVVLGESDLDGPEFVISIDTCPASSTTGFGPNSETGLPPDTKVTVAKVVVNYISLNALIRPFREIADFFSCEWPTSVEHSPKCMRVDELEPRINERSKSSKINTMHDSFRGFQLKIVAHYPRVFFLADENDIHSRALVLKGLAVANISIANKKEIYGTTSAGSVDVHQITSVNTDIHGLETYINPDVSTALRFSQRHFKMVGSKHFPNFNPVPDDELVDKDTLGIALIQPVTTGIEYTQIERDFFPTRRSLLINIDPVSTMLSFEDLQLVEVVLNRWSSDRSKNHPSEFVPKSKKMGEEKEPEEDAIQFEVVFKTKLLGLGLRTEGSQVFVNSIQKPEHTIQVIPGDVLISVGDENVQNKSLEQIVKILAGSERPIIVKFERTVISKVDRSIEIMMTKAEERCKEDLDNGNSISCYNLCFRSGMQLGLEFEKSPCGQFPVVSKIVSTVDDAIVLSTSADEMDSEQIEVVDSVFKSDHKRMPRIGAVLVAVDDIPVEEIGAEEIWQVLLKMQEADISPGLIGTETGGDVTFCLTFQETQASTWGNIDYIEISTAGMALSFIDDLNGRDMPLFRGKLNSVEIHIERGLGINAHILDNTIPSLLTPLYPDSTDNTEMTLSTDQVQDIQTESIISFSVIGICSVDYFHPRISIFEPLLEPSQLFFHFEKQDGSIQADRPAQVALEVSDRLLHNQFTRVNHFDEAHMVSVNMTDAAAEVLVEASTRWKDWRNSLLLLSDGGDIDYTDELILEEGHNSDRSLVSLKPMGNINQSLHSETEEAIQRQLARQRAAAKKAAQGALIFAQKRGAETSKKRDSEKPFIFRNRTGISIAFVQQGCGLRSRGFSWRARETGESSNVGEYDGLEDYEQQSITELADQDAAKFNMDIMDESFGDDIGRRRSIRHFTNKVRSYEGRYPDLMVAIQAVAGVLVEPITNLQVFKVGSTIRHLTVKKDNGSYAGSDSTRNSIQVVWKVEIEDNRRILTLSTAVRVVSPGMPLEIGVRRDENRNEDIEYRFSDNSTTSIGIARYECPFYMPLWLALKLESVSIYVRPAFAATMDYSWSESSVLHFGLFIEERMISDNFGLKTSITGKWTWEETISDFRCIHCTTDTGNPIWFSVFGTSSSQRPETDFVTHSRGKAKENIRGQRNEFESYEVLSVTLDSGLIIRNMLPMGIELEVVQGEQNRTKSEKEKSVESNFASIYQQSQISKFATLKGGECTEIFEVCYSATTPNVRISQHNSKGWSTWAPLKLEEIRETDEDNDTGHANVPTSIVSKTPSQVNVKIIDGDFGIPMVFGVRIVPKMTIDDPHRGCIYGLEVVIYAELWIRNITSLPLNFGCPAYQLHEPDQAFHVTKATLDDSVAKFTAETALMELANLLEVGDKGTTLNQKAAKENTERGNLIESLPEQECSELTEEVFEYVEIESSTVKRRWWASECYNGYHKETFDVDDTEKNWKWLDEKWAIDCSGGAIPSIGGWESCRNLYTGNMPFGGKRDFNPSDGFRRRRYHRRRSGCTEVDRRRFYTMTVQSQDKNSFSMLSPRMGGVQVFHQPIKDAFSREKKKIKQNWRKENSKENLYHNINDDNLKIAIKCSDGKWSSPAEIPDSGSCYGVIRVLASRWPKLTQRNGVTSPQDLPNRQAAERNSYSVQNRTISCDFRPGCLAADLYELCYTVSDVEGEWGEFSRSMEVSPRFLVRNDSNNIQMKIKQTGAPNSTGVTLKPGEASPFYWTDFRLPKLVSMIPLDKSGFEKNIYRWSGGFDLCNLGMTPVRIRKNEMDSKNSSLTVTSIRVLVEVRPGTGGHGINVSLREEEPNGDGSLFRIENLSPLPIWLSQDGILANPTTSTRTSSNNASLVDGDYVPPYTESAFALDVPYRQGKYAHRKEASLSELMHVRVALAPLSSRAGIESVKVIGLATMGETIRLNPMKLPLNLTSEGQAVTQRIRVIGVVATDGPTRVLRFCLMSYPGSDLVFHSAIPNISHVTSTQSRQREGLIRTSRKDYTPQVTQGINDAIKMAAKGRIPLELDAKRSALFTNLKPNSDNNDEYADGGASDKIFSFRMEFSGFVFSLVDSSPSEIAVISLRNVNALARWNNLRSTDATLLLSIGWLQVDNHIPSAPFKVAVRPDMSNQQEENGGSDSSPLLVIAVAFAPKHKSRIVVLRSVTVAPRNMVIALDLAFLVRLQSYFVGLQDHLRMRQQDVYSGLRTSFSDGMIAEQKKTVPFPSFESPEKQLEQIAAFSENQKMYFQGLTILPTNIKLSVAPAKALTSEQASLEGDEMAAIHEAVRKGDVLVGSSSSGPLGVRVGRKNQTPLAVVRGVFKSIVVDALLRLSGASLNFHGVFLRNHIATSNQLSTYLAAHYLSSLKHNVPALLGSLSAIGNPLGLIRGIGDGVSDFVTEPMKGFKRSLKELDPGYAVDGVARGTESLARHTVGGLADSASLLMETFSKYMAVVTLDRRYAQKRDRRKSLRLKSDSKVTLAGGVESGFMKLVQGFREGVTGVVRAPIRGAEKRGLEGFAKGLGKGLLGLLVKPIIGITDAATDVMIGVKSTVEYKDAQRQNLALLRNQFRPRRPMYGRDKVLRSYNMEDAAAATLMLKTRCAGENYLSHMDMNNRVALLSVKRLIILGPRGEEQLALKYKHVDRLEVRSILQEDGITDGWGIVVILNTPRRNGSEVEVISCQSEQEANNLRMVIQRGVDMICNDSFQET